jgi:hypothetical protein
MGTEFLSKLRAVTNRALRLTIPAPYPPPHAGREGPDHSHFGSDMGALFLRLGTPKAELVRADASWQPKPPLIRIEIMASGSFDGLRGIRTAVNRLQQNLVTASRRGTLELRLTEVRPACRHSTAWNREPVDPGDSTTTWQCFVDAFANESEHSRTLFAQAFRESLRNQVNHVVVFGDRFDDGLLFLGSAIRAFRRQGVRVSTFYLGDDFNERSRYRFLAVRTGGIFMPLSSEGSFDAVLPIVAAFACGDHARLAALSPTAPEERALIAQVRRR